MKSKTVAIVVLSTIAISIGVGAAGTYFFLVNRANARVLEVQSEITTLKDELLGHTRYTEYIAAGKQVLTEQAKFLAAKVVRDYHLVQHIETSRLGMASNATVIVHYAVEYSFGFDLKPGSFDMRAKPTGIEVRLDKPVLVSSPAVTPLSHEIPSIGLLTDEKTAVIQIHQRLPAIASLAGTTMAQDETIRALCEKKVVEFLRDFMGKQPGVRRVPAIVVVYR